MLPPASRAVLRQAPRIRTLQPRRLLSTAPPHQKSRSLRSSAARWGIVIGGLYYYNTSSVFAEEPPFSPSLAHPTTPEETSYPTLDSIKPTRRLKSLTASPETAPTTTIADSASGAFDDPRPAGLEETEQEASQEGAFNEETGEINWDCPCLGGMAHGPCGEQFREAFSCFVHSKEEHKGMDCIDKFKGMQDCFRLHPDVYDDQLANPELPEDDDDEEPALADAVDAAIEGIAGDAPVSTLPTSASALAQPSESSTPSSQAESRAGIPSSEEFPSPTPSDTNIHPSGTNIEDDISGRAKDATEQVKRDHETGGEEQLVPKEWHDTRQKNDVK